MKLRTLMGVLSPRWREPSPCEGCGDPFVCGATLAGCWCSEYELSEAKRAELRGRYNRCLCKACLERFAAEDSPQKL